MWERLLVGVDGSECGWVAARLAGELARRFGSRVVLVNVVHIPAEWLGSISGVPAGAMDSRMVGWGRQMSEEVLDRGMAYLHGVEVERRSELGHPLGVLLHLARHGVDLVVVGTRGRSELEAFLLGSTSDGLVHHAPCSVLLVRERAGESPEHPLGKLLVAVDGSPLSRQAVQVSAEVARRFGSQVLLLHVLEPGRRRSTAARILAEAEAALADCGCPVQTRLAQGRPEEHIVQAAAPEGTDLVALGSRWVGTVQALFMGSVSDRVAHHAPCPVLIVR